MVSQLVRLVVKDEFEQRDRFMRENLDALAQKLGEIQARMTQLESLGARVSGLPLSMEELQSTLDDLERLTSQRTDLLTVMESRLFDQKVRNMMVPTRLPVVGASPGSLFGWRIDPISGRSALHTGLDFQADVGTPILAAAGGLVVVQEFHPQYGNMVQIDHGNELVTLYAHASRVLVRKGDLIKHGQKIAEVGNTGRSTGSHLHFEVLVNGIPQDPQKFLDAGRTVTAQLQAGAGKSAVPPPSGTAVPSVRR